MLGAPIDLTYRITKGTGAFTGARGVGLAVFSPSISAQPGEVALTFGNATPPAPPAFPPSPPVKAIMLNGTVEGMTSQSASGTVDPLGMVTSSWTLTPSGAEPVNYSGTVTLVASSGSITASLSGRLFGPNRLGAPIVLTYTITGGTGAFAGATGSGKAVFSPSIAAQPGEVALTFGNTTPPAPPPPSFTPSPTAKSIVLNGTVEGMTSRSASGTVNPLGKVTSSWTLTALGAEPVNYNGTVTLVASSGSITASLSGAVFGPTVLGAPIDLTYTITGGTGAFAGATGSGKAVFSPRIASQPGEVALTFGDTTPPQ
jgi:hypothetical protein